MNKLKTSEEKLLKLLTTNEDGIIEQSGQKYNLTNMGAFSLAKNLTGTTFMSNGPLVVNKNEITKQHKQYREDNKDTYSELMKQWYENNKDKISERHKQWYENRS